VTSLVTLDSVRIETFLVEGPNVRVDELDRALRAANALILQLGNNLPLNTETTIDLAQYVGEMPQLSNLGVSVRRIEPQRVRVVVDSLATKEVPIVPRMADAKFGVSFVPATVTVRGPSRELEQPNLQAVYVDLKAEQLDQVGTQPLVLNNVALATPAGTQIRLVGEPKVTATVTPPLTEEIEYDIPAVPFFLMTHVQLVSRLQASVTLNDVPVRNTITNIKVRGPANLIREIQEGKLVVIAHANLQAGDNNLTNAPRRVLFDTPPGVEVISDPIQVLVTTKQQ
jgi:hypothetical protein